jgi:hypothetical protein
MHVRHLPFLVLAVGASLVLAGCGGGSASSPASATSPSTTGGASTANGTQSDLRSCLKQHGIDLPAGNGFGRGAGAGAPSGASGASGATPGSFPAGRTRPSLPAGVDQQAFRNALQACGGGNRNGRGGANSQAFTAYLSCLSDHGVTVPTSTSTSGTSGSTSGPQAGGGALSAVRRDPQFAAANKTCQVLLPTPGSTTTTTG